MPEKIWTTSDNNTDIAVKNVAASMALSGMPLTDKEIVQMEEYKNDAGRTGTRYSSDDSKI